MIDLPKIKVKKLFELDDARFAEYVRLQNVMKSKPEFIGKEAVEITSLQFGQVNELKRIFTEPTFEGIFYAFEAVFGAKKEEVLEADVVSYFYALNHIAEGVKTVFKKEKILEVDDEEERFFMKEAGAERLNRFQEFPILLNLAERFSTTPFVIETWKYSTVFTILLYDKILADVRKRRDEIKKAMKK